jgi:uridine kinase
MGRPRPLAVELLGQPASGKTTVQGMLRHFFRRGKFEVHAPREGAEAIEGPRPVPDYNLHTVEWALHHARLLRSNQQCQIGIFDRAIFDGVVRMEHYLASGEITAQEREIIEGYFLLPANARLFDLHIFLMCQPDTTFARKQKVEIIHQPGKTLNSETLNRLYEAHQRVWERLRLSEDQRFLWVDSDQLDRLQVADAILSAILAAFERHLSTD